VGEPGFLNGRSEVLGEIEDRPAFTNMKAWIGVPRHLQSARAFCARENAHVESRETAIIDSGMAFSSPARCQVDSLIKWTH
jgi:hypothetical protein